MAEGAFFVHEKCRKRKEVRKMIEGVLIPVPEEAKQKFKKNALITKVQKGQSLGENDLKELEKVVKLFPEKEFDALKVLTLNGSKS